jgi:hypothetical protein
MGAVKFDNLQDSSYLIVLRYLIFHAERYFGNSLQTSVSDPQNSTHLA